MPPGRAILRSVLRATRPNFLTLTPLCVLIGIGVTRASGNHVALADAVLALVGALLAHISVNLLNEHDDFRSGLDLHTVRTPFSGGSGSLPAHPEAAAATRMAGLLSLAVTAAIGVYFVNLRGLALLPLGLAGLLLIIAYTPRITHQPLLCLLAPGLGFGPLMVIGTVLALGGHYSTMAAFASLPPLFLVSELLLINQFPDVEADQRAGRRHLPIVIGRRRSAILFGSLILAAFGVIFVGCLRSMLPPLTVIALLPLPIGVYLGRRVYVHADAMQRLVPLMGMNVVMIHAVLALLAIGILLG